MEQGEVRRPWEILFSLRRALMRPRPRLEDAQRGWQSQESEESEPYTFRASFTSKSTMHRQRSCSQLPG